MNRLIEFIRNKYIFVIFILLELVAYNFYRNVSVYTKAEIYNISNTFYGNIYSLIDNISNSFSLKDNNDDLREVNARLRAELSTLEYLNMRLLRGDKVDTLVTSDINTMDNIGMITDSLVSTSIDSSDIYKDKYITARVLNNSLNNLKNYITLDRGSLDSIKINYPVVHNDAIVGYIIAVNKSYSIAMSVLNSDFKTSGMLSTDGSLCSIYWDGDSSEEAKFSGISRYTDINVGDTLLTTGFSSFFTRDKMIGTIKDFEIVDNRYYNGTIKLSTPFHKIKNVEIIFPYNIDKREQIEESVIK